MRIHFKQVLIFTYEILLNRIRWRSMESVVSCSPVHLHPYTVHRLVCMDDE